MKMKKILGIMSCALSGMAMAIFILACVVGATGIAFAGVFILMGIPLFLVGLVMSIIGIIVRRRPANIVALGISLLNAAFIAFILLGNVG